MSVPEEQGGVVFLVSQQDAQRDGLAKILQSGGFRTVFPPSADEALARLESADLLLLQTEAVGEAQIRLLDGARAAEAGWQVPVLVVADDAEPNTVRGCIERGAADCLGWPVNASLLLARVRASVAKKRRGDEALRAYQLALKEKAHAEALVDSVIPLAEAMMQGKPPIQLLELILVEGMRITDCEAGTIYLRTDADELRFVLVRNDTLDINMGGSVAKRVSFEPLRLYDQAGKPNHRYVASYATLTGTVVNVADAYAPGRFDFSGTRDFDARTGYHSRSFLTVPLKNHHQRVIGVLQLINARDARTGVISPFDTELQPPIEALAALAAAVMEAYRQSPGPAS